MTDTNNHNEAEHTADPDGQFSQRDTDDAVHNLRADETEATESLEHDQSNPAEHRADESEHGSANPGPSL